MKNKKFARKAFAPVSAITAGIALAAVGAQAQTTPVFSASFPAAWNGTSTTVTDQSTAGNTGYQSGTATYDTVDVPPGAAPGTGSMSVSGGGGIKVTPAALLNNTSVASAGGFTYNIDFEWNGSLNTYGTQKLVDYAGTESLELDSLTANTSATLDMTFGDDSGNESTPVSTTIVPNTWYDVTLAFNTAGNALGGTGDISGIASLYVNGSLVGSADATKGTYGDSLDRPIAIGELAYGHTTSIVGLEGDIYSASVDLGVPTPEPSTLALGVLGGLGTLGWRWKARRRQA